MRFFLRLVTSVVLLLASSGCASSGPPSFVASARDAPTLTLYRGVPRPGQLAPAGGADPDPGPVVEISGQTFYAKPVKLEGDKARALARVLADGSSYDEHRVKRCGGFHADWAVEWGGDEPRRVLLCFTCHETLSVSGDAQRLNDLTDSGYARVTAILGLPQ